MLTSRWPLLFALLWLGCDQPAPTDAGVDAGPGTDAGPATGPAAAVVDYEGDGFYAAPFPDERRRAADGTVDLSGFPNPLEMEIVAQLIGILDDGPGFATTSTIYFPMDASVDPASLPTDLYASMEDDSSVFLVEIDEDTTTIGPRHPVIVAFDDDPGPYGTEHLLGVLPVQGQPLAPNRLYAAVVTTSVRATDGSALGVGAGTSALLAGETPTGLSSEAAAAHQTAISALRAAGVADGDVAAMAVFRTWDPTAALRAAREQVLADALPAINAAPTLAETHPGFCVYETTIDLPDFQGGAAPYSEEGGEWVRDASGDLVVQRQARSTVYFTVPRTTMPDEGFPVVNFVRVGGGGDRPLIDRGVRDAEMNETETAGGPARYYAMAGWAGVQVDGPLGGLRNTGDWDEAFALFNIANPRGLRDNLRQTALELILFAHVLDSISFDASDCADLTTTADGPVLFDLSTLTLAGHSNGAAVGPLAVALEPLYRAVIFSGAGSSWIENVLHKESPIVVRPLAEGALGYVAIRRSLTMHDPGLALLQWAGETADVQAYARHIVTAPSEGEPRHALVFQGILDTYIPPPVANPLILSMELDVAGPALDETLADRFQPIRELLPLTGRQIRDTPVMGTHHGGTVTAVVAQHLEDDIEDGHEIMFQTDPPKLQARCFLESYAATGVPVVVAGDAAGCD